MLLEPTHHPKGWGSETWLVNTPLYCAKILTLKKGKRCSLHYHKVKTETMLVVEGRVLMLFGASQDSLQSMELGVGDVFHISPGLLHQFEGISDSIIHEFSTEHFESDSFRLVKGD